MADTKLTGLTALTGAGVASNDVLAIVDVSDSSMDATGTDKKITADELAKAVALLESFYEVNGTDVAVADGGTGASTAKAARANLQIAGIHAVADADYTVAAGVSVVVYTSLTAPRTVTLPAATSVNAGESVTVLDLSGSATATNTISIARGGTDTINGGTTAYVLSSPYAAIAFYSDGTSKFAGAKYNAHEVKQLLAGAGVRLTTSGDSTTADVIMDIQEFSVVGTATWTKPANALVTYVEVVSGGPGAGGGKTAAAGTIRLGGGGAGSGGVKRRYLNPADLGSTETVTIGDGGTGGAGGTTGGSNGSLGTNGGTSSFGAHVIATCVLSLSNAGSGNTGAGGSGSTDSDVVNNLFGGSVLCANAGGSSSSTTTATAGTSGSCLPGAGGGGGGIDASNVKRAGGAGGTGDPSGIAAGTGAATTSDGTAGGAGADASTHHGLGAGGGGGAPSTSSSVTGGAGGAGGFPGGGGGGGGPSVSGGTALGGAGGKGGKGRVRVITWIATT